MRIRGGTFLDAAYPAGVSEAAAALRLAAVSQLLRWVLEGWRLMASDVDVRPAATEDFEELERQITATLVPYIQMVIPSHSPFRVQHAAREWATRLPAPAQSPEYDFAFFMMSQPRVYWPVEAKVLQTDQRLAEYVREVEGNFVTCRYAPFVAEGAMLGYLLKGSRQMVFDGVASRLGVELLPSIDGAARSSNHARTLPAGFEGAPTLRLHHVVVEFSS